jgi:Zn-dependent M28 family amino/carboxypeptidase
MCALFSKRTVAADVSRAHSLRAHVDALTRFQRFYGNIKDLNAAADYIRSEFQRAGARVDEQQYTVAGRTFRNVIAQYGPESGELVIVGAHYDTAGGLPGADDNASGVAVLLELAHALNGASLKRPVHLVAFTNEEPPFFRGEHMGSFVHAKSLRERGAKVKGMICLEMVGYYAEEKGTQKYPIGWLKLYGTRGNFLTVVGGLGNFGLARRVSGAIDDAGVNSHMISAPSSVAGVDFSDHWSYWQHDYEAVMVTDTAFYRNPHYHEPTDTAATLDYERMSKVVEGVRAAVLKLAN